MDKEMKSDIITAVAMALLAVLFIFILGRIVLDEMNKDVTQFMCCEGFSNGTLCTDIGYDAEKDICYYTMCADIPLVDRMLNCTFETTNTTDLMLLGGTLD